MKLHKLTIATAISAAFAMSASGQIVAGWDFSQFTFGGDNSIGDTYPDYSEAGALNANYSELVPQGPAAGPLAASKGTIHYDGNFGSTSVSNLTAFGGSEVDGFDGGLSSVANQTSLPFNSNAAYNSLGINGQTIRNDMVLRIQDNVSIVFEANYGVSATDWDLTLAFQSPGTGGQNIAWSYSTNGSSYTPLGAGTSVTTVDAGDTIDFGTLLDGQSQVYIKADFSGTTPANPVYIDNVGISAVPEPATYAILFGVLALGFVLHRRFRQSR